MRGVIALHRFGLGASPGAVVPDDAERWLLGQLDRYEPRPGPIAAHPRTAETARAAALGFFPSGADGKTLPLEKRRARGRALRDYAAKMLAEGSEARLEAALLSETPFVERLVHFWANHFAVSASLGKVGAVAANLEFDAIRPHVLGRFEDLLLAAIRHPALLDYLDQVGSMGPNSPAAVRRNTYRRSMGAPDEFGANENFAREVLELHTLGVDGGYGQRDVIELAHALTGWSVANFVVRAQPTPAEPGAFVFHAAWHEPGRRTILGRIYAEQGERQGEAVLRDLARHPSTARHVAWKLARHFVADEPPKPVVDRLAARFLETGGNLSAVYTALVRSPEAWAPLPAKVRTPWEWGVAALKALGVRSAEGLDARGLFERLGQPVWTPGSPAGWPDIGHAWAGSNLMLRRIEAARSLAAAHGQAADAGALARTLFGEVSPPTRRALGTADGPEAVALLLLSREFHRR